MFAALSEGSLDPSHIAFFGALGPVIVAPHQKDPIWNVINALCPINTTMYEARTMHALCPDNTTMYELYTSNAL